MADLFPSYLGALIEGYPKVSKTTSVPQEKYIDSQGVGDIIEKLLNRLSDLLFHVDKQISRLLLRQINPPKKLSQWAMAARSLKHQGSDLLEKQRNGKSGSVECNQEMEEMRIKILNHLKECWLKDEMMYDKPTRRILRGTVSGLEKPSTRLELKCMTEQFMHEETEKSLKPPQAENTKHVPVVDFERGSKQISTSESMLGGEILTDESSHVHDKSNLLKIEQENLDTSSPQKTQHSDSHLVPEEKHYSFNMKDNHIELELDHHSMSIQLDDDQSSGTLESPLVNGLINLVEQGLRELPKRPDYPNSLVLFLQRNNRLTLIHPSFFESLPDLRFLDLSDTRIRILPGSIIGLSKLRVLMLRNCVCLEKIPSEIGQLSRLEVLDLLGAELYNLPDEIGELTRLRHMQLSLYGPDDESEYIHLPSELISDGVLSKLKGLETLIIIVHPEDHRWTNYASRLMKDVGSLERLRFIQFYFPKIDIFEDFIQMRSSREKQELSKFKFIVGQNVKRVVSRVPDEVESLYDQQDCSLRFVNGDKVTQEIKIALKNATAFYLDHHIEIQSLSDFGISNFRVLKLCLVRECPRIQVILDEEATKGAFPNLEHLRLYYLWELKRMWKSPVALGNFKALKYLVVNTCPKLEFILWESMLPCLSNLEELVVEDCASVETIIKEEKKKANNAAVVLPGLKKIVLNHLPKLVVLGNGLCRLSEDEITIHGCPKLIRKNKCVGERFSWFVMCLQYLDSKQSKWRLEVARIFYILMLLLLMLSISHFTTNLYIKLKGKQGI